MIDMKNVYYLQKHPVKIGDVIEHNGFRATVTEELIELNPELFRVEKNTQPMYFKCVKGEGEYNKGRIYKQVDSTGYPKIINLISEKGYDLAIYNWQSVYINESRKCFELTTKEEWDKQELLDKAKRDYPVGTMFESWYQKDKHNMIPKNSTLKWESNVIIVATDEFPLGMVTLYRDGRWVEVLPLKFITEDGVSIYGDMKTWKVYSNLTMSNKNINNEGTNSRIKYFYHKENALAYIEKHKEKTLRDYEEMLFENDNSMTFSPKSAYFSVYGWIKDNEPKLYYTKILQLIADDLNDGWVADFTDYNEKWYLKKKSINYIFQIMVQGVVYFKTKDLAEKARVILGNKVKYLFN